MRIKQKIFEKIKYSKVGKRMLEEQRYRIVSGATFSLFINLLYALYNGGLGIVNQSIWFITMCAYYTILSTLRFSVVLCGRKSNSNSSCDIEYFVMKVAGGLLVILSLVLTGIVYVSLTEAIVAKYDTVVMITIATYTFYKITMAIIRSVKQRANPSPLLAVIRSIGSADAAASALTLQKSMFATFGQTADTAKAHMMNILTGAAVCLFIFTLGIITILKGAKRKEHKYGKIKNC